MKYIHRSVDTCRKCSGRGYFNKDWPAGREVERFREDCEWCCGSGRVVKSVLIEPFDPDTEQRRLPGEEHL